MKVRLTNPQHTNFGEVVDAKFSGIQSNGAKLAPNMFFIHAWRPFDPDKPVTEQYREFFQLVTFDDAEIVEGEEEARKKYYD